MITAEQLQHLRKKRLIHIRNVIIDFFLLVYFIFSAFYVTIYMPQKGDVIGYTIAPVMLLFFAVTLDRFKYNIRRLKRVSKVLQVHSKRKQREKYE